jgi:hypothetical protein
LKLSETQASTSNHEFAAVHRDRPVETFEAFKLSRARETKAGEKPFEELFPDREQGDWVFWRAQRRPAKRKRLSWPDPTPCPVCGYPVGAVTRICARCHFSGWWWP